MFYKSTEKDTKCSADVTKFYSKQPVQKAVELLGKAYNIYFSPVYSESSDSPAGIDADLCCYDIFIDAYGKDVAIGFIKLSGTVRLYESISKVCGARFDDIRIMSKGVPNIAAINRLIKEKDTICYGALNYMAILNQRLGEKLNKLWDTIRE